MTVPETDESTPATSTVVGWRHLLHELLHFLSGLSGIAIAALCCIVLFTAIGLLTTLGRLSDLFTTPPVAFTSSHVLAELEGMQHLVPLRVRISEVLEVKQGSNRGIFIISGDALLTVDMAAAAKKDIDERAKTIRLTLPQPTVTSPRVDFTRSKLYDYQASTWKRWVSGATETQRLLTNAATQHAQNAIESAAGADEHVEAARNATENLLQLMFSESPWKVKVSWLAP